MIFRQTLYQWFHENFGGYTNYKKITYLKMNTYKYKYICMYEYKISLFYKQRN